MKGAKNEEKEEAVTFKREEKNLLFGTLEATLDFRAHP